MENSLDNHISKVTAAEDRIGEFNDELHNTPTNSKR